MHWLALTTDVKILSTSSNHKNPPNWKLQMPEPYWNMIQHDHDHHWTLVTTPPKKNKRYIYKGCFGKPTETKQTMVTTMPLFVPHSQALTTSWTGLPILVRSSKKHSWQIKYSYAAIWQHLFCCICKDLGRGLQHSSIDTFLWGFSTFNVELLQIFLSNWAGGKKKLNYEEYSTC